MTIVIERDDVEVHELIDALAVDSPVTRVPWKPSVASMFGERLLRSTTGPLGRQAGRVIARSLALVTGVALAAASGGLGTARASQRLATPRVTRRATLATSPDQAELVSRIAGPRFYHAIDDFTASPWAPVRVLEAERKLIDSCRGVFAVSTTLADTLAIRHGISRASITVLPNAVPADLIATVPPVPHLRRHEAADRAPPVAGVLGSLSSRIRLSWLREVVHATPWLHWRFVGGITESELAPGDRFHLRWLEGHPRCRFEGRRAYRQLVQYATKLDVAVMPYSERSNNSHGSPARMFAHLAAGHPILSTPGCDQVDELAGKLVTSCDDPGALIAELEHLRDRRFDDGLHRARWELAHQHTWSQRAQVLRDVIDRG